MKKLDRFCEAIMYYEGWYPGSRSYRNCNPGNLRWSKFAYGLDGGYAVFTTFNDGWKALIFDVSCKCLGKTSTKLLPTSNIKEFFEVYSPYHDNNDPDAYANFVCERADLFCEMELKELLTD